MIAVLALAADAEPLTGVQLLAFIGLAALAGAVAGDLLFGRHDRARARRAEADAARLRRHLMVLEGRSAVRRRRTRERAS